VRRTIRREVAVERTVRVVQTESLFDIPPSARSVQEWEVNLPIEERDWNVGLIVGPSGAGKSTVARECFPDALVPEHAWSPTSALLDEFPETMTTSDITGLFSAVGLGSVPTWVRPYSTLSTGEQFRASVAYALATLPELAVVDEWTSTVDRQVGRVTSAAAAKAVRRRHQQLVAVTCHYDVEKWLQPDWVYQPHLDRFTWRSLHPRPSICLTIAPVDRAVWRAFRQHHYLNAVLPAGECFGAFVEGECVAFALIGKIPHPSPKAKTIRRARRQVVLPDWQGLGIGTRMEDFLADYFSRQGYRFRSVTAHPGLIRHYARSPRWHLLRAASDVQLRSGANAHPALARHQSDSRLLQTYTYEYALPA
jgi:GNAT superfamily N-acetyltransferase